MPSERHIDEISAVLGFEFDFEESTHQILERHLRDRELPDPTFEFILDKYATSARFRLKWDENGPRVAYYPSIGSGSPEIEQKCAEITEELRRIVKK